MFFTILRDLFTSPTKFNSGRQSMGEHPIQLEAQPLKVKLKSTFRHAGAARKEGESVWVKAGRNGLVGFGEGCPRSYVSGENLDSSMRWIQEHCANEEWRFRDLEDIKGWVEENAHRIDDYPSAWCAVEMAFLDLFAREKNCSVEELLGLDDYERRGRYTAVLGDENEWKFTHLVDRYLVRGFSDFKVKLSGELKKDQLKLTILKERCDQQNVSGVRIRLDANNLWNGRSGDAVAHLKALNGPIFAVEEPVGAGDVDGIREVRVLTGLPVILDESLCTLSDLSLYRNLKEKLIANVKVSKTGGLIRTLTLIEELKKLAWPIIIGCHVGETSLLTRAALPAACVAGGNLIAQEGAFGDHLVEREPADPILKFGRHGILDLKRPYWIKTVRGLKVIPKENWDIGFGMQCRMPKVPDDGKPDILTLEMEDRYKLHYRRWGKREGEDVLMILHGGMSHSGWQAPLANALRSASRDLSVVAPDRRGCGLNEKRGDFGSVRSVVDDVVEHIMFLKRSFDRVHLGGWCQGCQYAAIAAAESGNSLTSLVLLTPGFFWNERFRSAISAAEKVFLDMISEFKLKPDPDHAYVPLPMVSTDFTFEEEWLDFIEKDELKTTMVTMKTVNIMDEIQELSWEAILENTLPALVVLAENDRIVDNNKVHQFIGHMFSEGNKNRLVKFGGSHAIHFERPMELAEEILRFMAKTNSSSFAGE
jgi:L-alanine-DL-glutamate epimerase-like enolase superfamily enzyme/pimeloyl-ACP methyl ester carboxylesterase